MFKPSKATFELLDNFIKRQSSGQEEKANAPKGDSDSDSEEYCPEKNSRVQKCYDCNVALLLKGH